MKFKLIFLVFILSVVNLYSSSATTGASGMIDFPTAYNLRPNNFRISAILDTVDEKANFGIMLESGFIPQIEAGLKLSTKDRLINKDLMKANLKFQFVREAENPAMAIGFVEEKEVYGYLVLSKTLNNVLWNNGSMDLTLGLKYDENKDTNIFMGTGTPIYSSIKIISEFYSYTEINEEQEKTKYSFNVGGEFFTTDSIITNIFYRNIDNSFGIFVTYLGIYR